MTKSTGWRVAGLLAASALACSAAASEGTAHWNHDPAGPTGPDAWGTLSFPHATCGGGEPFVEVGMKQSPVDIQTGRVVAATLPAVEFGLVGARLLAKTGDFDGARLAVAKLAALERFAPLAAGYWLALSRWLPEFDGQLEAIELALAASNAFLPARWARFAARVRVGDVEASRRAPAPGGTGLGVPPVQYRSSMPLVRIARHL